MLNLSFYSIWCRTVEVNNTDAEGRLVLGDGVRPVYMQNIFILVVDHSSVTNRHSETMEDRAWEIMMLLLNNLHQKRIKESQDGRNFGSARAIFYLHSLQLCTRVTREMFPFSANQTRVILSCIFLTAFHDCRVIVVCRGSVHFSVTKLPLVWWSLPFSFVPRWRMPRRISMPTLSLTWPPWLVPRVLQRDATTRHFWPTKRCGNQLVLRREEQVGTWLWVVNCHMVSTFQWISFDILDFIIENTVKQKVSACDEG